MPLVVSSLALTGIVANIITTYRLNKKNLEANRRLEELKGEVRWGFESQLKKLQTALESKKDSLRKLEEAFQLCGEVNLYVSKTTMVAAQILAKIPDRSKEELKNPIGRLRFLIQVYAPYLKDEVEKLANEVEAHRKTVGNVAVTLIKTVDTSKPNNPVAFGAVMQAASPHTQAVVEAVRRLEDGLVAEGQRLSSEISA